MRSDETEARIRMLLESYRFFVLDPARIVLLKQEKGAALSDANATFAMSDPYTISTKPHGHGDVHFLLHSKGICKKWHSEGIRWLHFFQDTNTLYFSNFLATLGVSATHEIAVNLVSCPRKAKEAVGAVCKLRRIFTLRDAPAELLAVEPRRRHREDLDLVGRAARARSSRPRPSRCMWCRMP